MPTLRQNICPAIERKNFEHAFHSEVVLVTGSGRGIGREIVLCFAKSGASVAVTGRTKEQVDATTEDVKSVLGNDAKAIGVVADGLKRDDLERLVKEVTE